MIAYSHNSRPFPRGRTANGGEMVMLTWCDLEFVVFCAHPRAPPFTFPPSQCLLSALMSFYVYHPSILSTKTPRHSCANSWRG
jgi:hypothetical protein